MRDTGDFWLVQRLKYRSWAKDKEFYERLGSEVKSNPFGYGRMGDYELDYMGSAEFEFGAIPKANNRLAGAGEDLKLSVGEHEWEGRKLDFLYIGEEGDPWETWVEWATGKEHRPPFASKEYPFDFHKKLTNPDYEYGGDVWWALDANIIWAFNDGEDGHLLKMLESMGSAPTEFLR